MTCWDPNFLQKQAHKSCLISDGRHSLLSLLIYHNGAAFNRAIVSTYVNRNARRGVRRVGTYLLVLHLVATSTALFRQCHQLLTHANSDSATCPTDNLFALIFCVDILQYLRTRVLVANTEPWVILDDSTCQNLASKYFVVPVNRICFTRSHSDRLAAGST